MLVYKYTRLRNLERIVRAGDVAFPVAGQLNDPFESSIESALLSLRSDYQPIPLDAQKPIMMSRNFGELINPNYHNNADNSYNERIREHNDTLRERERLLTLFREQVGVLSLTRSPLNSVMWAHYADNHTGVCIGLDAKNAFFAPISCEIGLAPFSVKFKESDLFKLGRVEYALTRPSSACTEHSEYLRRAYFSKHSSWAYEEELRLLRPMSPFASSNSVSVRKVPPGLVRSVTFGLATKSAIVGEATKWIRSLGGISVSQVRQKHDSYELELRGDGASQVT
jgi:hypothetical protein